MRNELRRLLFEKMLANDTADDRRINIVDRRRLKTYIANDRRSGLANRRAKDSVLMKRFLYGYKHERRKADYDRRKLNTFITNDRRSGIADRRLGP